MSDNACKNKIRKEAEKLGIKPAKAYKCPVCKNVIVGSLEEAVEHARIPAAPELPPGLVFKGKGIHNRETKSNYVICETSSLDMSHGIGFWVVEFNDCNPYGPVNTYEDISILYCLECTPLSPKEFERFKKKNGGSLEKIFEDFKEDYPDQKMPSLIRTTPAFERLVEDIAARKIMKAEGLKDRPETEWDENVKYYQQNLGEIRKKYGTGTCIAIHGQQVVDSDKNGYFLCDRVMKKYHGKAVVVQVGDGDKPAEISGIKILREDE